MSEVGVRLLAELEEQALPEVAGADAGRVELLDDRQHLLDLGHGVQGRRRRVGGRRRGLVLARVGVVGGLGFRREVPGHQLVDRAEDLLERRGEIAVLVDVAEELLAEQQLARGQRQHLELLAQVVDQVLGLDRDRLDVLLLFVLLAGAAHLEAVEQDLLPVDLVFLLFLLLLLLGVLLLGRLFLGLQQLEERIGQQLLLQVLLQVHHGHVQHVHGLVEPRIDPQLLPHAGVLGKPCLHATASRRARSRAVRVGPR